MDKQTFFAKLLNHTDVKMVTDSPGKACSIFLKLRFSVWFIFFLFSFVVLPANASEKQNDPVAIKGLIDLRQTDLSTQTVPLIGEWAIYWKKLITKTDSALAPVYVPFPEHWHNTVINGTTLPSIGYASYSITILLPHQHGKLALELPDTCSSYALYINGELFANSGKPDTSKETAVPKWLSQTLQLTQAADTLHLVLQVANFWHSKGGPYKKILIGDFDSLMKKREEAFAFDLVLTGCLLMGGLFFFGLYLFGKHDKVLLYFSLFSFTYSYRIIGAGYYVFHSLFPDIPWVITVHFEYLTLFISCIFFTVYTKNLYPEDTSNIFVVSGIWIGTLLSLVVILFPPSIFTQLINPFLFYMFGFIGYALYVYLKAWRKKRIGAKYATLSTAVVLVVCILINLQYFRLLTPQKVLIFAGYISFFFLQSLVLSFRFANTLKLAKQQAEEGLQAKNEFLSTMSHEIRTPLNSVLGMTHLILRNNPSPSQKEQLDILLFSANNLLAIVNDILDYNKIEAGKVNFELIEMDLRSLSKNIVLGLRSTAEDKGIDLEMRVDPSFEDKILGDPTRIGQVITNLVNNAIKFTIKGRVLLDIQVDSQTSTQITLTVKVEDTGIGIAPEKQKMIFEEFTQADTSTSRNFGGTGLGLAICKKLLLLQGSALQLTSEFGKGSTFYFTQTFKKVNTLSTEITSVIEKLPSEESKPLTGISILLVEDNEINILVAKTFLEKWGATIDVALNGQEALDIIDEKRHRLILMDLHMPVMDGYEATRIMRSRGLKLPIVALTASLPREVENRIKEIGVSEIIVKPFVPDDLYRTVLHFIGIDDTGDTKEQ